MGAFGGSQTEIYLGGLGDVVPELSGRLTRLEAIGRGGCRQTAFGYVAGSAGSEATSARQPGGLRLAGGSSPGCCATSRRGTSP